MDLVELPEDDFDFLDLVELPADDFDFLDLVELPADDFDFFLELIIYYSIYIICFSLECFYDAQCIWIAFQTVHDGRVGAVQLNVRI